MQTILTNAKLILENEVVEGTIVFDESGIIAVDQGRSQLPSAIDAGGDYVAPGLVEMHTDNAEKHFVPRPRVYWPNGLAAILSHDAQMAAAGVTTVYDAICFGYSDGEKDYRRQISGRVLQAVAQGMDRGAFRIDHKIHLRCELTGAFLIEDVLPHKDEPLIQLVSLMDHTPGQRQWRFVEQYRTYTLGAGNALPEDFDATMQKRIEEGPKHVAANCQAVIDTFKPRHVPIATHDDTTVAHVEEGLSLGAVICEFPTTVEAAAAAHGRGMATVAGAPNVVRGGSHSGGVSVSELAERDILDGLSSDYVPASLLQAVLKLSSHHGIALPKAMGMVTWKIADILDLADRGHLKTGMRGDIVRFRVLDDTPIVVSSWSGGRRAN
jgi:alpha-D-ribose 1-methylphosphonate 5-triphosphate diphosphatase